MFDDLRVGLLIPIDAAVRIFDESAEREPLGIDGTRVSVLDTVRDDSVQEQIVDVHGSLGKVVIRVDADVCTSFLHRTLVGTRNDPACDRIHNA